MCLTIASETIASEIAGEKTNPLAMHFPDSGDGLAGIQFVHAVIKSSNNNGSWEFI